ncbi:CRP-like cAMP-binding protein [Sphingomonas aerolata]|uniref:CRP-like cAMP-binding protein n=1 Tax=Sphingomonas aerolata TaxID=185951 RepID=A0A2T4YTW6_9SPHN|nr:Crp/Fnr family transcriptional regulator [Sphingomonas aerolata]PTM47258.1 CRP-like cAMP-binding protein [Sphingomonas aerolata]
MPRPDENPLARMVEKLGERARIPDKAIEAILQMPYVEKQLHPGSFLVREGAFADKCGVLVSGLIVYQKTNRDGDRQILSIKMPGDMLGLQSLYLDMPDYDIQALTRCKTVIVPSDLLKAISEEFVVVRHAISNIMLTEASILRELILNIGRRDARARLAHFLCEFAVRIGGTDKINNRSFELPLTQEQLGDALGLTAVHINRTLQLLTRDSLIARDGKNIRFIDWDRLQDIADFSTRYLHFAK